MISRPIYHTATEHCPGKIIRTPDMGFMMPRARAMREPQTGYLTIITAEGPRTIGHP